MGRIGQEMTLNYGPKFWAFGGQNYAQICELWRSKIAATANMFFDTCNVSLGELESQDSSAHCSHEPPSAAAAGHPDREAAGTKQQQQSSGSSLKTGAGVAGKQLPCLGSFLWEYKEAGTSSYFAEIQRQISARPPLMLFALNLAFVGKAQDYTPPTLVP